MGDITIIGCESLEFYPQVIFSPQYRRCIVHPTQASDSSSLPGRGREFISPFFSAQGLLKGVQCGTWRGVAVKEHVLACGQPDLQRWQGDRGDCVLLRERWAWRVRDMTAGKRKKIILLLSAVPSSRSVKQQDAMRRVGCWPGPKV